MITISNLKKNFGETVATDIPSFTINDGDILGLVGNNGAGKSTLFRIMLDLLKADNGTVTYTFPSLGEGSGVGPINPAESEDWKQYVGAYLDEGFLIDFLTPEEYFAFLGKISGKTQAEVDERLKDFERFAADEVFGQKKLIRNLSAGNLLTEYNKETGATILCSSHNLAHTVDISTRIALLEHGVIVRDIDNNEGAAAQELENYFEQ